MLSGSLLAILAFAIVPLLLVLIFKSERKQAKYAYHHDSALREFVKINFDKALPENNFKLVNGTGFLNVQDPLTDELFGLRVGSALRLERTVEIRVLTPKPKQKPLMDLPCDMNRDLKDEETDDSDLPDPEDRPDYTPKWLEIKEIDLGSGNENKKLPFGSHVTYADEATLGQYVLNQSQISKVGNPLAVDLNDDLVAKITNNIRNRHEFD